MGPVQHMRACIRAAQDRDREWAEREAAAARDEAFNRVRRRPRAKILKEED